MNQQQQWQAATSLPGVWNVPNLPMASAGCPAHKRRASQIANMLGMIAGVVLLCFCSYSLFSKYFVCAVMIQGRSMEPTLRDGQRYLLNRWTYHFRQPDRGDVVVLRDPGHADCAIKRVVAVPGDSIELKDGHLHINGQPLREPYLSVGTRTLPLSATRAVQLGKNQFFVLGDNRAESEDSRYYGAIHRNRILGCLLN